MNLPGKALPAVPSGPNGEASAAMASVEATMASATILFMRPTLAPPNSGGASTLVPWKALARRRAVRRYFARQRLEERGAHAAKGNVIVTGSIQRFIVVPFFDAGY